MSETENKQVVVLIHGTYAAKETDAGEDWWQVESDFCESLTSRLPNNIMPAQHNEVFHWGGENGHLFRLAAADNLLKHLKDLERRRVPYHIVAHSHGGSVVWQALNMSHFVFQASERTWKNNWDDFMRFIRREKPPKRLIYLKSITTVGTPYIHYRSNRLKSGFSFLVGLFLVLGAFVSGTFVALGVGVSYGAGYGFLLLLIALPFLAFGQRMIILSGALTTERFVELTVEQYAGLWQGVWSWDDEALALLKSALTLSTAPSIAPQAEKGIPRNLVAFGQGFFLFPEVVMTWLYDRFITPKLDRLLKRRLSCIILGVKDLGPVSAVEPWPHNGMRRDTSLSLTAQAKIRSSADAQLAESSTKVRPFLQFLAVGEVEKILKEFQEQKGYLVHSSYFESEEVQRLIAHHIIRNS